MNRRGFLKRAAGLVVAAIAAPVFIRSENLDFGVPQRGIVIATDAEIEEIARGFQVIPVGATAEAVHVWRIVDALDITSAANFIPTIWNERILKDLDADRVFSQVVDRSFEQGHSITINTHKYTAIRIEEYANKRRNSYLELLP